MLLLRFFSSKLTIGAGLCPFSVIWNMRNTIRFANLTNLETRYELGKTYLYQFGNRFISIRNSNDLIFSWGQEPPVITIMNWSNVMVDVIGSSEASCHTSDIFHMDYGISNALPGISILNHSFHTRMSLKMRKLQIITNKYLWSNQPWPSI